jgi:hypothetical protein
MGRLVGFESWVERGHLVALDFAPAVTAIVSQPFWLRRWTLAGKSCVTRRTSARGWPAGGPW